MIKSARGLGAGAAACVALVCAAAAQADVVFHLHPAAGMDPRAITAFNAAAARWSAQFHDPITINIDINFGPLGPGILGETNTNDLAISYSDVRSALIADARSRDDATAVAHLQPGPGLSFLTNDPATGNVINVPSSADYGYNNWLDVVRANAKALGLLAGNDSGTDGQITFSNAFSWDFDPSNGITPGTFDFVGIAAHEIGHVMGFMSGVDTMDYFSKPRGPGVLADLPDYAVFTPLDLYRYSAAGGPNTLDLADGGTKYFSLTGAIGGRPQFATGYFNGDGRQASHWKDNLGLGIMDPTAGYGEMLKITANDVQALDVIGYDSVPAPGIVGGFAVQAACLALVVWRRRRARKNGAAAEFS